jgi:tetratricopeptide (TPR) repeat protein
MRAAIGAISYDSTRRVIPVLLPGAADSKDSKVSKFLLWRPWVDFRSSLNDEKALYRLSCGIRGIRLGHGESEETGSLPISSYLPFTRNFLFTGRDSILHSLAENFFNNKSSMQAITGMGGLGKTQLAVEFAHRYGDHFKGVHWLDLRDVQALDSSIALCGTKMGYTQIDQSELVAVTMKAWEKDGPRLLILDNFEDMAQSINVLARFSHPSLKLLVTSRRKDFDKSIGLRVRELELFTKEESLEFLGKTLKQTEIAQNRKELAEKLGYLPLALEMAADYININKMGIEGYLKELADIMKHESMQAEWFREMEVNNPTKHDQSMFGTFQLSWREVKDVTQQKIFMLAGYLAPNTPIPLEIFRESLELDDKALFRALYRLDSIGLLPAINGRPSIHPLLAAYARTLAAVSKELLEKLADKLVGLAKQANDQVDQSGSLIWFVPLRPHILSAAAFAEAAEAKDAAILLGHLGYYLLKIADYQGAKFANERALKITEAVHGQNHPEVAMLVNNLGMVLQALGDLAGAKAAFERALKITEAVHGQNHPEVARVVNNLGMVLQAIGDLVGATAVIDRALQINIAVYGPDHPEVAILVNNLGTVLKDLGDLAGAKAAYERALKIDEAAFGPDHPDVAIRLSNLGLVLHALGDLAGAKAACERALKIAEAVYGPDNPVVATDVNNLGRVLQALGDLAGAKAAYERAFKIFKKFLHEDHPNIKVVQENVDAVTKGE